MSSRRALIIASYVYEDQGLQQLVAPEHDAESLSAVLRDPEIAGFDVSTLINEPHYVVGEAIADFYAQGQGDDLTLLYFSGHGVKDDEGRLYLAMTNTKLRTVQWSGISASQLNEAMDASPSRRKVLILDCCYSGAFPAGRTAKSDPAVHTLERFQGKGRAVLTASDSTQYAFEGENITGSGTSSVFTRCLVEALRSGNADLDNDGDIALDELYRYVHDRVVSAMPQQRPKRQEDVDGRIIIARNVNWSMPLYLQAAIDSPLTSQRLGAVDGLEHLHQVGNVFVRASVIQHLTRLTDDDSRGVSAAASALLERLQSNHVRQAKPPASTSPRLELTGRKTADHQAPLGRTAPSAPAEQTEDSTAQRTPPQRQLPVRRPRSRRLPQKEAKQEAAGLGARQATPNLKEQEAAGQLGREVAPPQALRQEAEQRWAARREAQLRAAEEDEQQLATMRKAESLAADEAKQLRDEVQEAEARLARASDHQEGAKRPAREAEDFRVKERAALDAETRLDVLRAAIDAEEHRIRPSGAGAPTSPDDDTRRIFTFFAVTIGLLLLSILIYASTAGASYG